ncbi:hypothetical protein MLPF_3327 [Mycobacterium lepromatosis]|nr:hypothetical protein MLPF_3327 [Mycobacterium lepromatosis]
MLHAIDKPACGMPMSPKSAFTAANRTTNRDNMLDKFRQVSRRLLSKTQIVTFEDVSVSTAEKRSDAVFNTGSVAAVNAPTMRAYPP